MIEEFENKAAKSMPVTREAIEEARRLCQVFFQRRKFQLDPGRFYSVVSPSMQAAQDSREALLAAAEDFIHTGAAIRALVGPR